jgi:hypothetical protein
MAQKRYDEAETTLVTGMEALLTHHQTVSASELGQQLIKLYVDTHKSPTDATIGSLAFLHHLLCVATTNVAYTCRVQRRSFDTFTATAPMWTTAA